MYYVLRPIKRRRRQMKNRWIQQPRCTWISKGIHFVYAVVTVPPVYAPCALLPKYQFCRFCYVFSFCRFDDDTLIVQAAKKVRSNFLFENQNDRQTGYSKTKVLLEFQKASISFTLRSLYLLYMRFVLSSQNIRSVAFATFFSLGQFGNDTPIVHAPK